MTSTPTARVSVTAEVVGTGSDGTEPSLLFSVQRHGVYSRDVTLLKRYLFNCGEGTQRLCGENGVKLSSLDSIFFTRFDVHSVSGVPGMIFSLSTCGAASLRLHGPAGLRAFVGSIQSFVRRKYPRVLCIETSTADDDSTVQSDHSAAFDSQSWQADDDQSDQHMRIAAVTLHALAAEATQSNCLLCERGDCVPACVLRAKQECRSSGATSGASNSNKSNSSKSESPDRQFRKWLVRFYTVKEPAKVPFADVILNRYHGRFGDLRAQLEAKYGALDGNDDTSSDNERSMPAASSSSSSSDSSDSEDDDVTTNADGPDSDTPTHFDTLAFSRDWLVRFYRQHQPEKLLHVDRVLQQFSGREETLKHMLLSKYASAPNETTDEQLPLSKRRKLGCSAEVAAADPTAVSGSAADVSPVQDEVPAVYVEPLADDDPVHTGSSPPSSSLCYVMKFLHDVHAVVWIIDCRDTAHICSLTSQFAASAVCVDHAPVLIVHFSPVHVVLDTRYQAWMQAFGSAQQLVFDGRTLERVAGGIYSWVFRASARHTLEQQSKQRFELVRNNSNSSSSVHATCDYSRTGWQLQQQDESSASDEQALPSSQSRPLAHANALRLVVLGTGSAAPSRLRGSTAMYLELDVRPSSDCTPHAMLIDCGEGTFGQLVRQFGDATAARIGALQCVWISHSHADHQCGLVRVLYEFVRYNASQSLQRALLVIAPQSVVAYARSWMDHILDACGVVEPARRASVVGFATCREFNAPHHAHRHTLFRHIGSAVRDVVSVPVWHCYDAFGLVLTLASGAKVVYSGDTRPCSQLIAAGLDAALLIHEATFDDSMRDDAVKKKHCTVAEALDVAQQMRAREVVLTHFSQRYPKLPPPIADAAAGTDANARTPSARVHCAFDGFVLYVPIGSSVK